MTRPDFIKNWSEIEPKEALSPPRANEAFAFHTPYSRQMELKRLRVNHIRLTPGTRMLVPGVSRDEEEFVYILEGTPDLWADGYLYALGEGDGVGFPDRTGIAHTIINNSENDVRLLVIGEMARYSSKYIHPLDPAMNEGLRRMRKLWENPPESKRGPHDALPDKKRGTPSPANTRKSGLPDYVVHWKKIQRAPWSYPGSTEKHGVHSKFARHLGLARVGVHHELLPPGTRTSWPHAERDEEEFVFVLEGEPDAWIDGVMHRLKTGDGIGFPDKTGISHVFINNTKSPVRLLVAGEASRTNAKVFYPVHPKRNKEIGDRFWADAPKQKMGPHDGMPDALRKGAPKANPAKAKPQPAKRKK